MRNSLAAVLLAFSAAVPAQQLGTLFLTTQERDLLDRQRRGEATESKGAPAVEPYEPSITGYVKRSDGKSTVFLDKRPYPARGESVQRQLVPRIIDRYDAPAPPPPPAPEAAKAASPGKEGPSAPPSPAGATRVPGER